jgi:hypothetical protein
VEWRQQRTMEISFFPISILFVMHSIIRRFASGPRLGQRASKYSALSKTWFTENEFLVKIDLGLKTGPFICKLLLPLFKGLESPEGIASQ